MRRYIVNELLYCLGLDLGQAQDYTALTIDQVVWARKDTASPRAINPPRELQHFVRHLERFPLGTPYPAMVAKVAEMVNDPSLARRCMLAVDATGVGRPVVDLLRAAQLPVCLYPVTITAGDHVYYDQASGLWRVPKKELVSVLQVLFDSERLKIAKELEHVKTLADELLTFRAKISDAGHDTYGAWREGTHDDMVLATALACWLGEYHRPRKPARVVKLRFA
jgi:hypothetical protein